jgi:two-component system response regulator AtoC
MSPRTLVVDDDEAVRRFLGEALPPQGYEVETRASVGAALAALGAGEFDVVITDAHLPRQTGLELCQTLARTRPDVPVVVTTALGNMALAVSALRAGAFDFITKPFEVDALVKILARAVRKRARRAEVKRLRAAGGPSPGFAGLIGASPPMRQLFARLERAAAIDASVLVTGASGTGKELVARAIHAASARRERAFVTIACASLGEPLLEAELFGHGQSAGAGLLKSAEGGTVFLDELAELPPALQAGLLRVLRERALPGGGRAASIDLRVVVATCSDPGALVREGRLSAELAERLGSPIALPALRDRGNDILLLAQRFIETFATRLGKPVRGLAPAAAELLLAYPWPGNVRELQNWMERAVTLALFDEIGPEDLPQRPSKPPPARVVTAGRQLLETLTLAELERRRVLDALASAGGDRGVAAQALGLDRATLWRKLERYADRARDPS